MVTKKIGVMMLKVIVPLALTVVKSLMTKHAYRFLRECDNRKRR